MEMNSPRMGTEMKAQTRIGGKFQILTLPVIQKMNGSLEGMNASCIIKWQLIRAGFPVI